MADDNTVLLTRHRVLRDLRFHSNVERIAREGHSAPIRRLVDAAQVRAALATLYGLGLRSLEQLAGVGTASFEVLNVFVVKRINH